MVASSLRTLILLESTQTIKLSPEGEEKNWEKEIKDFGLSIDSVDFDEKDKKFVYVISGDSKLIDVFMMYAQGPKGVRVSSPRTMLPWGAELAGPSVGGEY